MDYVWACGERKLARAAYSIAVKSWGIPTTQVYWSPYWLEGQPRP
ncbi:SIP domain-containing protein [Corynebacterium poyangense]